MSGDADLARLADILAALLEATSPATADAVVVGKPPGDPAAVALEIFGVGSGLAARELAGGVLREAHAHSPLNALRLARHLFEYRVYVEYVLADPVVRIDEAYADEVKKRAKIRGYVPDLHSQTAEASIAVEEQEAMLASAEEGRASGKRGDLPNLADMARGVGLGDDYNLYYRSSSWLAHPGVGGSSEAYLVLNLEGGLQTRGSGHGEPSTTLSALALACMSLAGVFHAIGDIQPLWLGVRARVAAIVRASDAKPGGN